MALKSQDALRPDAIRAAPARALSAARRERGSAERAQPRAGVRLSMASTTEEPPVDGAGDCATRCRYSRWGLASRLLDGAAHRDIVEEIWTTSYVPNEEDIMEEPEKLADLLLDSIKRDQVDEVQDYVKRGRQFANTSLEALQERYLTLLTDFINSGDFIDSALSAIPAMLAKRQA